VRGALNSPFSWFSAWAVEKGQKNAWVSLTLRPGSEPLFTEIAPSLAELEDAITPWICEHDIRHTVTRRCAEYIFQVADADHSKTLDKQEVRPS
jgi:hypothetical protein